MSIYKPLPTATSTRVLELLPSTSRKIHAQLQVIDIADTNVPFKAISWAWNSDFERSQELSCAVESVEEMLPITKTLHSLLHRLQIPVTIWLDALSINQKDLSERAQQVTMMNLVFGKAETVIVNLGEEPKYFADFTSFLKQLQAGRYGFDERTNTFTEREKVMSEFHWLYEDRRPFTALADIMSRPYFERVWVSQEYVLARKIVILIGLQIFDDQFLPSLIQMGQVLFALAKNYSMTQWVDLNLVRTIVHSADRIRTLLNLRKLYRQSKLPEDVGYLVCQHLVLKATDPRDKLFGLCGFLKEPVIAVDYAANTDAISIQASKEIFTSPMREYLFHYQVGISSLPSWCIDLQQKRSGRESWTTTIIKASFKHGQHRAAGNTSFAPRLEGNYLIMDSLFIDAIKEPGTLQPKSSVFGGDWFQWCEWKNEAQEFLHDQLPNVSEVDLREMFWRTVAKVPLQVVDARVVIDALEYQQNFYNEFLRDTRNSTETIPRMDAERRQHAVGDNAFGRGRLTVTRESRSAFVPPNVESGDMIAILAGVPVPYVLRKGDRETYRLVGQCNLYGMMQGEALDKEGASFSTITIS